MRFAWKVGQPSALIAAAVLIFMCGVAFATISRQTLVPEVFVTFTDSKVVVSPSHLQAGSAAFVVVNKGRKLHALTIKGPGLDGARLLRVAPGKSATIRVTLRTGSYGLLDPVGLGKSKMRWVVVRPATTGGGGSNGLPFTPTTRPKTSKTTTTVDYMECGV